MAGDFEDIYDLENMTDEEIAELVREELDGYPDLDASGLDIDVRSGKVTVGGRIGTEAELQMVEQVLTDVIGLPSVDNQMMVDSLSRVHQDEAADVANAELYGSPRGQRGGANRTEDTAAHLLDDTGAEQFGTNDMGEAIERGYSYNPSSTPIQEGTRNAEDH
jgi:hypothetical protein